MEKKKRGSFSKFQNSILGNSPLREQCDVITSEYSVALLMVSLVSHVCLANTKKKSNNKLNGRI